MTAGITGVHLRRPAGPSLRSGHPCRVELPPDPTHAGPSFRSGHPCRVELPQSPTHAGASFRSAEVDEGMGALVRKLVRAWLVVAAAILATRRQHATSKLVGLGASLARRSSA